MPMISIVGPIVCFPKPMLVDIMTAMSGPFGFCTGKPMQVETMLNVVFLLVPCCTGVRVR